MATADTERESVGGVFGREQIIGLGAYWQDVRIEWDDGKYIYIGAHKTHGTGINEDTWEIWKYTWVDNTWVRREGPLQGSWKGRHQLAWTDA